MNKSWFSALVGLAALGTLPGVSAAQYGGSYSPYYYARHGSYYEPNYSSAYGNGSASAGYSASQVYGGEYSPYYYARHGSYYEPNYYSAYGNGAPLSYSYARPGYLSSYYSYAAPSNVGTTPLYYYGQPNAFQSSYISPDYTPSLTAEGYRPNAAAAARALVEVLVARDAQVWFDGDKTSQTGSMRTYVSPPLRTGPVYTYNVRARWTDDKGQTADETRTVEVQPGRTIRVDFLRPAATSANLNTRPNPSTATKPDGGTSGQPNSKLKTAPRP